MRMDDKHGSPASVHIQSLAISPSSCTVHHAKRVIHPHMDVPIAILLFTGCPNPKNTESWNGIRLEGTLKAIQFQ